MIDPHGQELIKITEELFWPDAYQGTFYPITPYVRIPFRTRLLEPIDDYPYQDFCEWLDMYSTYTTFLRYMKKVIG